MGHGEKKNVNHVLQRNQRNMQKEEKKQEKKWVNGFNMKDNFDIYKQIDWLKVIGHLIILGLCLWLWFKIFIAIVKFF